MKITISADVESEAGEKEAIIFSDANVDIEHVRMTVGKKTYIMDLDELIPVMSAFDTKKSRMRDREEE